MNGYFYFTRGQRNGTLILVLIMFLIFVFPYICNLFNKSSRYYPDPGFIKQVNAFYLLSGHEGQTAEIQGEPELLSPCPDRVPNESGPRQTEESLTGEPVRQASQHQDKALLPQPQLPDKTALPARMKIDINSADTTELMMIRGIGPVLSRRILKYRDILGGYYTVSQLLEVYGIDKDRYLETEPFVFADTSTIVKLSPVSDEFGVLLRHPYLKYEQVSEIFRLRSGNKLNSPEDLLLSAVFNEADLTRLYPYFSFD